MARRRPRRRRRQPLWLFPRVGERKFIRQLREIMPRRLEALVRELVLPRLSSLVQQASIFRPGPGRRVDAWPDEVRRLREILAEGLGDVPAQAEQSASEIAIDLSTTNRQQWFKIQRSLVGVAIGQSEPWFQDQMNTFTSQNASLIGKLSEESIANIEGEIQRGLQSGLRVESIREGVLNQVDVSFNRAKLIARDQVAKFNSQLTQLRQESLGVSRYVWRTSRDERVRGRPGGLYASSRPTHWALEGKECSWSDATIYYDADGEERSRASIQAVELHPGQDFQCRCTAEPVLDELLGEPREPEPEAEPIPKEEPSELEESLSVVAKAEPTTVEMTAEARVAIPGLTSTQFRNLSREMRAQVRGVIAARKRSLKAGLRYAKIVRREQGEEAAKRVFEDLRQKLGPVEFPS